MSHQRAMMFGSVQKLPMKYATWIMPLFLSCLMSGTISLINFLVHSGFSANFISKWFPIWMFSWAIAYPVVLIFLPIVRKITGFLVDLNPENSPN